METPLAKAANRGTVLMEVPITLAFPCPRETPRFSRYSRTKGPISEADPANARPNPSSMDFLPSSRTSRGISSYFVPTINSETYLVRPGAFGKALSEHGAAADKRLSAKPAAAMAAELLKKSRRFISASPPEEAVAKRFFLILVLLILQHYSANE